MKDVIPLTPVEQRLYGILAAVADAGEPCPTNEVLAERLGVKTSSGISTVIRMIEVKGFITVERAMRWRRIRITASGRSTETPRSQRKSASLRRNKPRKPPEKPAIDLQAEADAFLSLRGRRTEHHAIRSGSCFNCGVRGAVHDEMGCSRWRAE